MISEISFTDINLNNISFRLARISDKDQIIELCRECFPIDYPSTWYNELIHMHELASTPLPTFNGSLLSTFAPQATAPINSARYPRGVFTLLAVYTAPNPIPLSSKNGDCHCSIHPNLPHIDLDSSRVSSTSDSEPDSLPNSSVHSLLAYNYTASTSPIDNSSNDHSDCLSSKDSVFQQTVHCKGCSCSGASETALLSHQTQHVCNSKIAQPNAVGAVISELVVGMIAVEVKSRDRVNAEDSEVLDFRPRDSPELHALYILSLGVRFQFRRLGIASKLLKRILSLLTDSCDVNEHISRYTPRVSPNSDPEPVCRCYERMFSCARIRAVYLHVLATNTNAISFYEKNCFHLHVLLPAYYLLAGDCEPRDGFTYVRYINGGRPSPSFLEQSSEWLCDASHALQRALSLVCALLLVPCVRALRCVGGCTAGRLVRRPLHAGAQLWSALCRAFMYWLYRSHIDADELERAHSHPHFADSAASAVIANGGQQVLYSNGSTAEQPRTPRRLANTLTNPMRDRVLVNHV